MNRIPLTSLALLAAIPGVVAADPARELAQTLDAHTARIADPSAGTSSPKPRPC